MSWLEKVKAARAEGSLAEAIAVLNAELSLRPQDPLLHYQVGWSHDALGKESDAAFAYERAIELGLTGEDLKGCYLSLGSTYRTLGEYEKSKKVLEKGIGEFPDYRALKTFLSLTLFNLGAADRAMEILLKQLVETTSDPGIQSYDRALLFYSDKLSQIFD